MNKNESSWGWHNIEKFVIGSIDGCSSNYGRRPQHKHRSLYDYNYQCSVELCTSHATKTIKNQWRDGDRLNIDNKPNVSKTVQFKQNLLERTLHSTSKRKRLYLLHSRHSLDMCSIICSVWILMIILGIHSVSGTVSNGRQMTEVFSVVSGSAHLPCDLTPP